MSLGVCVMCIGNCEDRQLVFLWHGGHPTLCGMCLKIDKDTPEATCFSILLIVTKTICNLAPV